MASIKAWFDVLGDEDKRLFLVNAGSNLSMFGRQANTIDQLKGVNELHEKIYNAIRDVGTPRFDADVLWAGLNELAKGYRLDMALQQAFNMAMTAMQTRM